MSKTGGEGQTGPNSNSVSDSNSASDSSQVIIIDDEKYGFIEDDEYEFGFDNVKGEQGESGEVKPGGGRMRR